LPRQARDRHRKRGTKRATFLQVIASERDGPAHQLWRAPTDNDEAGLNVGIPKWLAEVVKQYPNPLWSYAERWRYAVRFFRLFPPFLAFFGAIVVVLYREWKTTIICCCQAWLGATTTVL
jgi:hypothetical protein